MEAWLRAGSLDELRLVGGNLALDFVNTRSGPRGSFDTEWLSTHDDFVAWCRAVPELAALEPRRVVASEAVAALARVQAFRDVLYDIFTAIVDGNPPGDADLQRLQLTYVDAIARGRPIFGAAGLHWHWGADRDALAPLWAIAVEAVEHLSNGTIDRLKAYGACPFFFIDQSKNGSRRWCSMDDCGKSTKMARYVERRAKARRQLSGHRPA